MSYPILIGSKALEFYGVSKVVPRDVDIITDSTKAGELALKCQKKDGKLMFFENVVVDVSLVGENPVTNLLFDLMTNRTLLPEPKLTTIVLNKSESVKTTTKEGNDTAKTATPSAKTAKEGNPTKTDKTAPINEDLSLECWVPPLEWLYCIIRGHIHRIPTKFPSQKENVTLWKKHMSRYHAIRNHIGYKKLDAQFKTDPVMPKIFETQFDYINSLVGDAQTMEKAEAEFFKDNVTRYIEHDELHRQVAQINRNSDELLFKRYQTMPDSVEMDETLFLQAPRSDQLNTIREELMVLFLERKLIPMVVEHGDKLEDLSYYHQDGFQELVCHFITNLCGTGHSWLRQWCLDHYKLFNIMATYNYPTTALRRFALSFGGEGKILGVEKGQRITSLSDFLAYFKAIYKHRDNQNVYLVIEIEKSFKPGGECHHLISTYNLDKQDKLAMTGNEFIELYNCCHPDCYYWNDSYAFAPYIFDLKFKIKLPSEIAEVEQLFIKKEILVEMRTDQTIVYNYRWGLGLCLRTHGSYIFCIETKVGNQRVTYGVQVFPILIPVTAQKEPVHEFPIPVTAQKEPVVDTVYNADYADYYDEDEAYVSTYKSYKDEFKTASRYVSTSTYYDSSCYGETSTYYDSGCYGESSYSKSISYIGHFGASRAELENMLEFLARVYLRLPQDEKSDDE